MCFENVPCMAFYIEKKKNRGLERLLDDVRFILNLSFNASNLSFIVSGTLACVHKHTHEYTSLKHEYAYACLRTHSLGFGWPLFSKNSFI